MAHSNTWVKTSSMSNPFLRLLGSVTNNEGYFAMGWTHSCRRLKDTLFRIQEGSTCEVLNNLVFVMVDQSVLSAFDWFFGKPTTFFMVVKVDRIELRLSG